LLLNNFEAHLVFSSVCSVSLWLNDLFQWSLESTLKSGEEQETPAEHIAHLLVCERL